MKRVFVRGADGSERELALVRTDEKTAYVCPLGSMAAVEGGNEESIVGFPLEDVREVAMSDSAPLSQLDKFKEAARQLETDDDSEHFKERLKKVAKHKLVEKPE